MKRKIMRSIFAFVVFTISVIAVCFAQTNQTESISITTYYPSPNGVYTNLRLNPSKQITFSDPENHLGTMYFNDSEQSAYIFVDNGTAYTWERIGSAGSSGRVLTDTVYPDQCSGTKSTGAIAGQLCSKPWHKDITFTAPFSKVPHVMVFMKNATDIVNSSCAGNATDQFIVYPANISTNNFTVWASGSVDNGDADLCNADGQHNAIEDWYTRSEVSWFAISE